MYCKVGILRLTRKESLLNTNYTLNAAKLLSGSKTYQGKKGIGHFSLDCLITDM